MAPEIFDPDGPPFHINVDVYAMGILMWEMLSRARPWDGVNNGMIAHRVFRDDERPPMPPNAVVAIRKLIEDCWQKDAELRPDFDDIYRRLKDDVGDSLTV